MQKTYAIVRRSLKGWSRERRETFEAKANKIIADNLQFGLIVVMRDDDYRQIYKRPANPYKFRQDSKYGLLFRGCLQQIEYAVTQNIFPPAPDLRLDFILEQGHDNTGDVLRLFELAKKEHLQGCEHILGTVTLGDKTIYGLQAADLLMHGKNRLEMKDYSRQSGDVSKSSYLRQRGSPPVQGYAEYRFAITRKALQGLRDDFHYPDEKRTSMQSR